ncbi:MAG: transposase [Candidatus Methanoperedens sp.]|nr:transposase [Candidatus Methanoperedens sp.]PKL54161.1 MAG: hypothetical protein CVV36_03390 [Candidatus Methanoperedenaceae archaeon HGW-Methanoperedenaceae-1]
MIKSYIYIPHKLTKIKEETLDEMCLEFMKVCNDFTKLLPSIQKKRVLKNDRVKWSLPSTTSKDNAYNKWVKNGTIKSNLNSLAIHSAKVEAVGKFKMWLEDKTAEKPLFKTPFIDFNNQSYFIIRKNENTFILDVPSFKNEKGYPRLLIPFNVDSNRSLSKYLKKSIIIGERKRADELKLSESKYANSHIIIPFDDGINEPDEYTPHTFIGIDRGINNIIALSVCDNSGKVLRTKLFGGNELRHYRTKHQHRREKLQAIYGKDKGMIRRTLGKHESKFAKTLNHQISHEVVEISKKYPSPVIVIEDLHRFAKNLRWSFYQLEEFITYKAKINGIVTKKVKAQYTSQTCSRCGHVDKANRYGVKFACDKCGHRDNADINAAINISRSYINEVAGKQVLPVTGGVSLPLSPAR